MNFPTGEIATLVNAVCADADCRRTIRPQSNWAHGPLRCFRLAGWARNTLNEHRDRVDPSRVPKGPTKLFFNHKTLQPYTLTAGATPEQMANSPTQREMCFGIARQTIRVINQTIGSHRDTLGRSLLAAKEGSSDGAHYAPLLTTTNGDKFVLDWWMTLEIDNPIVWDFSEWKIWPHGNVLGVEFKSLTERLPPVGQQWMMP